MQPRSSWTAQRAGEARPAAIRALVLYPMNALVEDQMVRLRRTLDSDEARAVMDGRFAGNRSSSDSTPAPRRSPATSIIRACRIATREEAQQPEAEAAARGAARLRS